MLNNSQVVNPFNKYTLALKPLTSKKKKTEDDMNEIYRLQFESSLYMNGGTWNGKRIVSEEWVKESTSEHSRWKKLDLPYGYLWWVGKDNGYAAMGDGGNIIYISPEDNMVVAITSLFYPRAKDRIEFIGKYVKPLF